MPYRPTDANVNLPELTPTKASFGMSEIRKHISKRTIAGVSLGPHLEGAALPHPDISDAEGAQLGCRKRFGTRMPKFNRKMTKRLMRFTKKWLKKNLVPFAASHKFDIEAWLADTNYPEARKEELRREWAENFNLLSERSVSAKAFVKDEYYPEYKYPRIINSRQDPFKCFFGPVVKDIETKLYANHHFIKHTPVAERPEYIRSHLHRMGAKYFGTDFTSFESSFVQEISYKLEFLLFEYLLQEHSIWVIMVEVLAKVKFGFNTIIFKHFRAWILSTRLSGEMDTSCSNGFSNLMINLFILIKICHAKWCDGVVEGDDGLFAFLGKLFPQSCHYKDLGFNIKIQRFENLFEASFCGIVFDEDTLVNIACPYKNLAKFGWTTHTYSKASASTKLKLLRAKSLSLAYQYPGAPVLQELAKFGMRVTKHVNLGNFTVQSDGWWEREMAKLITAQGDPLFRPVEMSTRLLMERCFGMSVDEQIRIESYLSEKNDLSPLRLDISSFPDVWVKNYYTYGVNSTEVDQFARPYSNRANCGFETISLPTHNQSKRKIIRLGYVDYKNMRYYDALPRTKCETLVWHNFRMS